MTELLPLNGTVLSARKPRMTETALAESLAFAASRIEIARLEVEHGDIHAACREIDRAIERMREAVVELRNDDVAA